MLPDENFIPIFTKYFAKDNLSPKEVRYVKSWIRNYTPNSARGAWALLLIVLNVGLMISIDHSFLSEYTVYIIATTFFGSLLFLDLILKKRAVIVIKKLME
jgi:hypothetical protein